MIQDKLQMTTQGRVPAEATLKFINRAEVKFDNMETSINELITSITIMKKDIQTICEKLDENKEEHKAIMNKMDEFITGCDKKYAEKSDFDFWKRVLIYGILISIFLGVISLMLDRFSK